MNDVKKFRNGPATWYLMGMHLNGDRLWFALSRDGRRFQEARVLATRLGEADRYMVALGWVVQGEQETPGRKVLGFLYGAGREAHLAGNRIFARWLQKRVVLFGEDGARYDGHRALGPDRVILPVPPGRRVKGALRIYAEDGERPLGEMAGVEVEAGQVYTLLVR